MSDTELQDLAASLNRSDKALWLGRLVWYSVSDVKVDYDDLFKALTRAGLGGYAPRLPSDVDVFRKVCSANQRKKMPVDNSDSYDNYLLRDLPPDAYRVRKVLVKETVSADHLTYTTELCRVEFIRPADKDKTILSPAEKAAKRLDISCTGTDVVAAVIANKIRQDFMAGVGKIDSYGVRELIRKVLLEAFATNVRGKNGGLYFVSERYGAMVDRLEALAEALPGEVQVHSLPLLDDTKQREMLRRAFESESADEINIMMGEIAESRRKGEKFSPRRIETYTEAMTRFRSKAKEYSSLLETTLDTTASQLKLFQRQIMNVMAEAEETEPKGQ